VANSRRGSAEGPREGINLGSQCPGRIRHQCQQRCIKFRAMVPRMLIRSRHESTSTARIWGRSKPTASCNFSSEKSYSPCRFRWCQWCQWTRTFTRLGDTIPRPPGGAGGGILSPQPPSASGEGRLRRKNAWQAGRSGSAAKLVSRNSGKFASTDTSGWDDRPLPARSPGRRLDRPQCLGGRQRVLRGPEAAHANGHHSQPGPAPPQFPDGLEPALPGRNRSQSTRSVAPGGASTPLPHPGPAAPDTRPTPVRRWITSRTKGRSSITRMRAMAIPRCRLSPARSQPRVGDCHVQENRHVEKNPPSCLSLAGAGEGLPCNQTARYSTAASTSRRHVPARSAGTGLAIGKLRYAFTVTERSPW
jgi:hypothetical protein